MQTISGCTHRTHADSIRVHTELMQTLSGCTQNSCRLHQGAQRIHADSIRVHRIHADPLRVHKTHADSIRVRCTELTQTLSGSQIPCKPTEGMHNSCSYPTPCTRYKGPLNSCAPWHNILKLSRLYHGEQNPCRLYQGVYTLWRVHRVHADYQGAQTCVHFIKGTQNSCRLSGCTNLCTFWRVHRIHSDHHGAQTCVHLWSERYTEFMQTIRVHRPVYTLWRVHRVHPGYQGPQTCVNFLKG